MKRDVCTHHACIGKVGGEPGGHGPDVALHTILKFPRIQPRKRETVSRPALFARAVLRSMDVNERFRPSACFVQGHDCDDCVCRDRGGVRRLHVA